MASGGGIGPSTHRCEDSSHLEEAVAAAISVAPSPAMSQPLSHATGGSSLHFRHSPRSFGIEGPSFLILDDDEESEYKLDLRQLYCSLYNI